MFPNTFELFYQFLIGHGLGIYFIPINLIIILLYILYNSLISSFYLFIYLYITVGSDIKIETRITPLIQTFIFVEWVAQGLTTRYQANNWQIGLATVCKCRDNVKRVLLSNYKSLVHWAIPDTIRNPKFNNEKFKLFKGKHYYIYILIHKLK